MSSEITLQSPLFVTPVPEPALLQSTMTDALELVVQTRILLVNPNRYVPFQTSFAQLTVFPVQPNGVIPWV